MNASSPAELVALLRARSQGVEEWRVQHPETGTYCISFDREDRLFPERCAREWLDDHKARYPHHEFAGYVVASVQVYSEQDRLMQQAATMIEAMELQAPADTEAVLVATRTDIADVIVLAVAELPDRDSPEDQPDMMLVTSEELRNIVIDALTPPRSES
jgi:hypothetical protein